MAQGASVNRHKRDICGDMLGGMERAQAGRARGHQSSKKRSQVERTRGHQSGMERAQVGHARGHQSGMEKAQGDTKKCMEPPPLPSVPQHPAAPTPPPAAARRYGCCSRLETRRAVPRHIPCHRNAVSPCCPGTRLLRKVLARSSGPQAPHKSVVMPVVEMAAQHCMGGDPHTQQSPCATQHRGLPLCTYLLPDGPTLTFSLILATLSPITCFCTSRKDFRAAAVLRRKVLPRCRSARSAARRVARASFISPAVPLAITSACLEFAADARMLR